MHYLLDHGTIIVCYGLTSVMIVAILNAIHASSLVITMVMLLITLSFLIPFIIDMIHYFTVIHRFTSTYRSLDHSEYITDLLERPSSLLGQDIYDLLQGCNTNMRLTIKKYHDDQLELTKYMQLWVHQIKLPLSALQVLVKPKDEAMMVQINRLRYDLDMILYYCRLKNTKQDFLLRSVDLKQVIHDVLIAQRVNLQQAGFEISTFTDPIMVYTDSKWIEFMIEQIVSNAIKYKDEQKHPSLVFTIGSTDSTITLHITDNGLGIHRHDLPYVFDPFFTGHNGYTNANSSGMGLTLIKTMADALHIHLSIESELGEYTTVNLGFTTITNL